MKCLLTTICSLLVSGLISGQTPLEKGLQTITRQTAEAHVRFLAHDELEGREAGSRGGRIAREYIVANLRNLGIAPLNIDYLQCFESYKKASPTKNRFQVHPDSINVIKEGVHQRLSMCNVLGILPGINSEEYVVVGAHYDHLGMDSSLVGDQVYNGADDNASGVSAVLQIARAFLATGIQPKRNVIFAFWDGEEKGALGSSFFVQNCTYVSSLKGYLNFDMIGRNNDEATPSRFVYFYTEAFPVFGKWLKDDIKQYKLHLTPDYRPWDKPIGGSDNSSFAKKDIPIVWYHTNGHPDYHQPTDHADRINWDKVVDITKASFLNLWNLANEQY